MPSRSSRKKSAPPGPGSKPKAGVASSSKPSPLRQSSRVKKPLPKPNGKLKRKRADSGDEKVSTGDSDTDSASDFNDEGTDDVDEVDVSDEDNDDDNEPQTYSVPLPKARDAGDTPYQDNRIHPNTFLFLKDLKANNNRDWLKWNDKDFRMSLKDFETFVEQLSQLVMDQDPTVPDLPKKDVIFRIYRDIRFSHDPTPYKPFFSAAWSRTGKKGPYAAYYVQLQPGGNSFVGGGLWHPDGPALATIREDIDTQPQRMKAALMNQNLRRTFFEKAKSDEKKVVAAFVASNSEGALKTKPKGFDADHKDLNLLRLRNFTMGKKITDAEILAEDGIETIANIIGALVPWATYLNSVVMPDPHGGDDDSESD